MYALYNTNVPLTVIRLFSFKNVNFFFHDHPNIRFVLCDDFEGVNNVLYNILVASSGWKILGLL
jgi:hypothetical protein